MHLAFDVHSHKLLIRTRFLQVDPPSLHPHLFKLGSLSPYLHCMQPPSKPSQGFVLSAKQSPFLSPVPSKATPGLQDSARLRGTACRAEQQQQFASRVALQNTPALQPPTFPLHPPPASSNHQQEQSGHASPAHAPQSALPPPTHALDALPHRGSAQAESAQTSHAEMPPPVAAGGTGGSEPSSITAHRQPHQDHHPHHPLPEAGSSAGLQSAREEQLLRYVEQLKERLKVRGLAWRVQLFPKVLRVS